MTISAADIDEVSRNLRHDLVATLTETKALRSPGWISAFKTVPRHVFVPRFLIDRKCTGSYELLDGEEATNRREWLERVYSDESLATQLDRDEWVSSSSQPSLMAMMLEALNIAGHERVLEVGTGTGYNAALLCAVLGDSQVVSIDIDSDLVAAARRHLKSLEYRPILASADGAAGYPEFAPYDRIIATCSMFQIPTTWITQATEGGMILVNLYRDSAAARWRSCTSRMERRRETFCRSRVDSCRLVHTPLQTALTYWKDTAKAMSLSVRRKSMLRYFEMMHSECSPRCEFPLNGSSSCQMTDQSNSGYSGKTVRKHSRAW